MPYFCKNKQKKRLPAIDSRKNRNGHALPGREIPAAERFIMIHTKNEEITNPRKHVSRLAHSHSTIAGKNAMVQ